MGRPTVGTVSGTTAGGGGGGGAGSVGAGGGQGGPRECAGCGKAIRERYLLKALEMFWHEDCLKCGCCDCRLGEVGSTLYTKANLILCKRDYLRLFGTTGYCAACNKVIPAFEMVMRAKSNVYHLECFACQQCNHRFCVGDRFYLCDNKILCEYDYEERLVFANMACNPSSLAHIRRQVSNLQPGSNLSVGGADGSGFQHPLLMLQPPPAAALPSTLSKAHQLCDDKQLATNPHHQIGIPNHGRHFAVSGNHRHAGGGADDASSGYGSPDSDSLEVR